ncbi:MAG: hypothetical protein ACLTS6_09525 [Anaerobutyricum sp.]
MESEKKKEKRRRERKTHWPADAGIEYVGSRKALCSVKKAGRKSAGWSSREEGY